MSRIIGVDIDGVLADLELPIKLAIEKEFGVKPDEQKRDEYYMHDRFNIDPKAMRIFLDELFYTPGFWASAEPFYDNIYALANHRGFDIILITGRDNSARTETIEWLYNKCSYFTWRGLLMNTLQLKHQALKFCGASAMIEDRYAEAATIAAKGFNSYLIETHYNREFKGRDDGVVWVRDIADALKREGLQVPMAVSKRSATVQYMQQKAVHGGDN